MKGTFAHVSNVIKVGWFFPKPAFYGMQMLLITRFNSLYSE